MLIKRVSSDLIQYALTVSLIDNFLFWTFSLTQPIYNAKTNCLDSLYFLMTSSLSKLVAQESMIPEVSNSYLNQLIDTAKKYYPIVQINQKRIDIAYINMRKTNVSWFDVLSLTFNYSPNGNSGTSLNQPTYTGFQVGLFVNIGNLLTKPYLIKAAKEEYEIAKLNKQDNLNLVAADVKDRYIKYVQRTVLLRMQSKIAIEAESVVKEARYKFEKGRPILKLLRKR